MATVLSFPFSREEKRQVGLEYGHLTPQWSSDGQLIAFGGYGHIHTIKANGRGLQIISEKNDDVHTAYRSPNTSRDGARIAYIAFVHKRLWPLEADFQWEIVTSELDGSSKRRLTKSSKEEEFYVANLNPVWSPDGTRIAFTSNNLPDGVRYFTVFTMAADGSDVRGIVPSIRSKVSFDRDRLYDPLSWSPDSRSLAFVATKNRRGCSPLCPIYLWSRWLGCNKPRGDDKRSGMVAGQQSDSVCEASRRYIHAFRVRYGRFQPSEDS